MLVILGIVLICLIIYYCMSFKKKKNVQINDIEIVERPAEIEKIVDKFNFINPSQNNKFQFYVNKENITNDILNNNINPIIMASNNTNPSKNVIDNVLKPAHFTLDDVQVLKNKNYLKNFYYDLHGNRIQSTLKDYFVNYDTTIDDEDDSKCVKVDIIKKNSGFIIPNQYPTLKYQTNAYNVDWTRIINPLTLY